MEAIYAPEKIEKLGPNEVFVFGSNMSGYHVGAAAKFAVKHFGAVYGKAEGLQGKSYAIPTTVPTIQELKEHVDIFIRFAREHHDLTFLLTPVGCGVSGFKPYDVALLFLDAYKLKNVVFPKIFAEILDTHSRFMGIPMNTWNGENNFCNPIKLIKNALLPSKEKIKEVYRKVFYNTVQIVNSGFYITEDGERVQLPSSQRMEEGSVFYTEKFSVENVPALKESTRISVINRDCLKAALDLQDKGYNPIVLNMASQYNPGGGVKHGSKAQEESIFRRTDIFRSLYQYAPFADRFGVKKSEEQYPMIDRYGGIYSPYVCVFRDSEMHGCRLLKRPRHISVVSVAAINRPKLASTGLISDDLVEGIKERIRTIFRIGLRHRHDAIVLGAWGCGAFCNPPRHIAYLFREVILEKEFRNKFRKIVFAIVEDNNSHKEHNPDGNLLPFQKIFNSTLEMNEKRYDLERRRNER